MQIDYRKFKARFARSSRLLSIKYHTVLDAEKADNPHIKLLDWLDYHGYHIVKKIGRGLADDTKGNPKSSAVVELSVDLVLMANYADHIVLVGAHSDYCYPVIQAQRLGARVTLLSSMKAQGIRPASELRRIADDFTELDDLRDAVAMLDYDGMAAD
jgi:uncharacterized LabA/DUF88 family protein